MAYEDRTKQETIANTRVGQLGENGLSGTNHPFESWPHLSTSRWSHYWALVQQRRPKLRQDPRRISVHQLLKEGFLNDRSPGGAVPLIRAHF